MADEPRTLLAATQAGGTSLEVLIRHSTQIPTGVSANGLTGIEEIAIQFYTPDGWVAVEETLTAVITRRDIVGFGRWRLVQPATAANTSIFQHSGVGSR